MRMFDDCPFMRIDPEQDFPIWCVDGSESTGSWAHCKPGKDECYLNDMMNRARAMADDWLRSKRFGGFPTYQEYLNSEHWQEVRKKALEHYRHACVLDRQHTAGLNVHHNNYDNLGNETMADVIVLCRDCHAKYHEKVV